MKTFTTTSLLSLLGTAALSQNSEKPNVIVFLVDDMGVMDTSVPFLSAEDGEVKRQPLNDWYRTPNMARLAEQGVRFSKFYAQSVSSPTRASIITGQNATRHRTTNWINPSSNNRTTFGPKQWNWLGVKKSDVTLQGIMKEAGYKTIHVGKAHFGPKKSEGEYPDAIGFDVNIAGSAIGHPGSYYGKDGYGHIKGGKSHAVNDLEKYHGTDVFLTEALTLEAKNEIEKATESDQPFFLYMAHYALHAPFHSDQRFIANYMPNKTKSKSACAFASLVQGMDKSLGDLMDHLQDLGVAENTLILFVGDNGSDAPLGDQGGHFCSAPLRGKKGTEYEGGVRVPFIAAWAAVNPSNRLQQENPIATGHVAYERGTVMDIFPTITQLVGINTPEHHYVDGYDLWKLFDGQKDRRHSKKSIAMHFPHEHRGNYFTTFIEDGWKLIYYYRPKTPNSPSCKLYNLNEDPFENNDLAKLEPKRVKKMIKAMKTQLDNEGALYPQDKSGKAITPIVSLN